jgi:hypothetical protein
MYIVEWPESAPFHVVVGKININTMKPADLSVVQHLCIYGPPGCGKSTAATEIRLRTGRKLIDPDLLPKSSVARTVLLDHISSYRERAEIKNMKKVAAGRYWIVVLVEVIKGKELIPDPSGSASALIAVESSTVLELNTPKLHVSLGRININDDLSRLSRYQDSFKPFEFLAIQGAIGDSYPVPCYVVHENDVPTFVALRETVRHSFGLADSLHEFIPHITLASDAGPGTARLRALSIAVFPDALTPGAWLPSRIRKAFDTYVDIVSEELRPILKEMKGQSVIPILHPMCCPSLPGTVIVGLRTQLLTAVGGIEKRARANDELFLARLYSSIDMTILTPLSMRYESIASLLSFAPLELSRLDHTRNYTLKGMSDLNVYAPSQTRIYVKSEEDLTQNVLSSALLGAAVEVGRPPVDSPSAFGEVMIYSSETPSGKKLKQDSKWQPISNFASNMSLYTVEEDERASSRWKAFKAIVLSTKEEFEKLSNADYITLYPAIQDEFIPEDRLRDLATSA